MSSTALPSRQRPVPEREQLDLFRALPGDMAPRDSQDLMAFPFFSLAKSRRVAPIDFRASGITIREETPDREAPPIDAPPGEPRAAPPLPAARETEAAPAN